MVKISGLINRTLTFRLTFRVMLALAMLLMAALLTMFYYSRKAVKEEAVQNAGQALEATVERIDNILLSVEQASGNIYWRMLPHINQKDRLEDYARRLKEGNSYVVDCHIDWNTDS